MMLHHTTKLGCKRFWTSEEDIFEDFCLHCDLDFEDRNINLSHNTPGYDDAPPYQVSLRKVKWFRTYCLHKIFPVNLSPHCDRDLEDSNPKWSHNTPTRADAPLYHICLQKVYKYRRYVRNSYSWRIWASTVTLILNNNNNE